METRYRAKVLIHDELSDRPRRMMATERLFRTRSEAADFLESFTSWLPVQDTEIIAVGVSDCRKCGHTLDENVNYCPMCGREDP